jgi:hypothetical protein
MRFLHVLFAIGFTLGLIRTRGVVAPIKDWRSRVLVIDMTIKLFLSWPSILVIFASFLGTLPRSTVSLLVLGEIARSLELLRASRFSAALWRQLGG